MIFKGSFRMNGFENTHKYLWQYNKQNDSSGTYLYHVIRPLFKTNCKTKYWEFDTRTKKPNLNLTLANGDSITIEHILRKNEYLYITITWTQTTSVIWNSIKDTSIGKIMSGLENKNLNTEVLQNMGNNIDQELDNAVIFCQNLANGIQILQDKLSENDGNSNKDTQNIFPKGESIKKKVTYIGIPD